MFVSACQRTWLSLEGKKGADDHVYLRMPTNLIVFGRQKKVQMTMFISTCQRTWLSLEGKKVRMIMFVSACQRTWLSLEGKKMQMTMFVSACQQTSLSLEGKKGVDDHVCLLMPTDLIVFGKQKRCGWPCSSLQANGLDCLWKAKMVQMTMFVSAYQWTWLSLEGKNGVDDHVCLRMPMDLIVSRMRKGADDHVCLCMPTDLIVSGRQRRL